MPKSLRQYLVDNNTRKQLTLALLPKYRCVEFNSVLSEEECQRQILTNLRFIKLAFQQHNIPITIIFRGKKNLKMKWRYPEFGYSCASSYRVPQLLHLLQIVNERISIKKITTIRDIYYGNVQLFESQRCVEYLIGRLETMFSVDRRFFNIVSTQKGLIYSSNQILIGQQQLPTSKACLIPYLDNENFLITAQSPIKRVIVVEKDAVFQRLIQCENVVKDCIIITGKGYPDFLSRNLLYQMDQCVDKDIEFHIYTDSDPYGIDIVTKYLSHPTKNDVQCQRLEFKGIYLHDLIRGSRSDCTKLLSLLPLNLKDNIFAMSLSKRLFDNMEIGSKMKKKLRNEIQHQLFFQRKAEMNVVQDGKFEKYIQQLFN